MSCLLVDNPSYDPTTPLQSHLALSISHSQHSFINKFGLINLPPLNASDKHEPVGDTPYGDSDRQQQIRPIHSVLGDEGREDEYCPLYVSEAGTVEI